MMPAAGFRWDPLDRDRAISSFVISSVPPPLGRQAFYRQPQMPVSDAYEYAEELVVRNMAHTDAREGIAAFVEKRRPVWKRAVTA